MKNKKHREIKKTSNEVDNIVRNRYNIQENEVSNKNNEVSNIINRPPKNREDYRENHPNI